MSAIVNHDELLPISLAADIKIPDIEHERIYVGGLDPSRGLTVELVASRLSAVQGVEILSINDVPTNSKQRDIESNTDSKSINKVKLPIVDEDGDLVDTRNFFYLEARAAAAAATGESSSPAASALELLAKQYNGVKWKGCNLRVEASRPHFLKRLEGERALRDGDKQDAINAQMNKTTTEEIKEDKEAIKNRRRLRIRKRFGEEAFHVDTLPHPLEICQDQPHDDVDGWDQFATLNKRMHDKWQSQYKKLVEKRKQDRRMWASGKGTGKNDPVSASTNAENGDNLRCLIFLNRGIHIRFSDRDVVGKQAIMKRIAQDDTVSVSSSSAASSNSDDTDDSEDEMENNGGRDGYVWSDDDDDDDVDVDGKTNNAKGDNQNTVSTDEIEAIVDEKPKQGCQYAWSDDEEGEDDSDGSCRRSSKEIEQQNEATDDIFNQKERKKIVNGADYTKAVAMDEFVGGMDFDLASNHFEGDTAPDSEGDNDDSGSESEDASRFCLDDDIRSNMGVLAQLFPDEHFDKRPLVPSIASGVGGGDNSNRDGNGGHGNVNHSSSLFGAGLIVPRYDPTKESDQKFEMPRASKDSSSNVANSPPQEMNESKDNKSQENASASSESSDDENELQQATKLDEDSTLIDDGSAATVTENAGDKKLRIATNVVGKVVPAKDVFDQDKLEDIFKQARGEMPESFSLGNLFDTEEKNQPSKPEVTDEREIYEQDKLEDVFKQARGDSAGTGGFTFGFPNQQSVENAVNGDGGSAPFSFGFDLVTRKNAEEGTCGPEIESDAIQKMSTALETEGRPRNKLSRGRFSKSELDVFENLFFSLNEGPQILKDLEGMRHNEENQERWQKERQVLTDDWKRKQKSTLSKKGKKARVVYR